VQGVASSNPAAPTNTYPHRAAPEERGTSTRLCRTWHSVIKISILRLATEAMRQQLDSLSAQTPAACQSPMTLAIKLPCGDVVSCTKMGDQVHCDAAAGPGR
jgi:hypothetical protein